MGARRTKKDHNTSPWSIGSGELKVSDYDQKIPESQTADQPTHREDEPHDIYSNKASERQ